MNKQNGRDSRLIAIAFFAIMLFILISITFQNFQASEIRKATFITPTLVSEKFGYSLHNGTYLDSYQKFNFHVDKQLAMVDSQYAVRDFTFVEEGKIYHFRVSPPGDQNLEFGDPKIVVSSENVTYNGIHFIKQTWSRDSKPFLIHATVQDEGNLYLYDFSIELPPINTQKYINLFDQTLSTLKSTQ